MNGRRSRHTAMLVIALVQVLVLAGGAFTQARGATPPAAENPQSRADLYEMFDIGSVGADIVVAVDTSLSMKKDFTMVRQALDGFSRTLEPGDDLSIIVFNNHARKVYDGPAGQTAKINAALPKAPDTKGQKTNMGEAMDAIVGELEGERKKLPVVLFLSDGLDDPPPESAFAVRKGEAWKNLRDRAAREPNSKRAFVHGIGLNDNTDVDLLKQLWPRAQPIAVAPDDLNTHFKQLKERIRLERLRHEVRKELGAGGVTARLKEENLGALRPGTTKDATLIVKSDYKKLPIEVDLSGISWRRFTRDSDKNAAAPKMVIAAKRFTLAPGETRKVAVKVVAPGQDKSGDIKLQKEDEGRGVLDMEIRAETPVASKISDLGIEPRVKMGVDGREVYFTRSTGVALYVLIAFFLAALTAALGFGRYAVTPASQLVYRRFFAPELFGRLAFSAAPGGTRLPPPVSLDGLGRKATLGAAGDIPLRGTGIKPVHAELYTIWSEGEPRMMVRPVEGAVRTARSPASTPIMVVEEAELPPGGVMEIGEYKIQWS